jgi:AcrR family transcriptional regulator
MANEDSGGTPAADGVRTRDRILGAAARLFTERGFAATTTRDIAAVVGISQPGLYKHFAGKDAILVALAEIALVPPADAADRLTRAEGPAAVRLYAWLEGTCVHLAEAPYALAALLTTPELALPRFARFGQLNRAGERFVADLVRQGVEEGDFRPVDPVRAARLTLGLVDTLSLSATAEDVAALLDHAFHALLCRPERLPVLRAAALGLADQRSGSGSAPADRARGRQSRGE